MAKPSPQEIKDIRDQSKLEDAYMDSLTVTSPAPKKTVPKKNTPSDQIPPGGMVRSGGKLVPRKLSDMGDKDAIVPMRDKGRGLEVVPDKYAKGGSVSSRGDGIAQRGKTRGKVF